MDRRYFITSSSAVGFTMAAVPSFIFAANKTHDAITYKSREFIEYSSEMVNKFHDYSLGGILPAMLPLAIYACTEELIYLILFLFILITSGVIIF
jgi:hypothetical protein